MNGKRGFIRFGGHPRYRRVLRIAVVLVAGLFAGLPGLIAQAQSAPATEANLPRIERGYKPPSGLEVTAARGTGRTTGHIATLTVRNTADQPVELPPAMFYIPATGKYQGYVGWPAPVQPLPPGASQEVPIEGYCSDVRLPPVPAGEAMPPPEDWIVSTGQTGPVEIPAIDRPAAPGAVLVPGTDSPLPRAVSVNDEPMVAVPLLLAAVREIEQATEELQAGGELVTPFSSNPERERQAVVQQTFWIFAAELENEQPYTQEEFTERLEAQYESSTGVPIAEAPEEDQQQLEQGAGDFWNAFQLVGAEAKVINVKPAGGLGAAAGQPGADAEGERPVASAKASGQPAAAAAPPGCTVDESIVHTPEYLVQVKIGENYGNEEERETITKGIREAVESQEAVYVTSTPPSTSYSIWRKDHVGGISSGYAKVVFLEENDQEWVWSTEELSTSASGNGVHTLSFTHGPECKAVVAGSAGLWLKATSEAFDPLENSIEYFRALDGVKEATVKYLGSKLPPGLDDALEAGVEAITDPSSDTWASASGSATLVVGDDKDSGTAANRVVYKRKDKEDKAIIGGGETVKSIKVSDRKPDSLTSRIDASVTMEAGAEGNGHAKAYLESIYGTILIGVCECPNAPPIYRVVTDNSQFIRTDVAKAVVERAMREMQTAAELIGHSIETGSQETDGESLQERAEAELEKWVKDVAGDRFAPKEQDPVSQ